MRASVLFLLAGLLEIGGGYLVWMWFRRGFHLGIGIAGFLALAAYGIVPALRPR